MWERMTSSSLLLSSQLQPSQARHKHLSCHGKHFQGNFDFYILNIDLKRIFNTINSHCRNSRSRLKTRPSLRRGMRKGVWWFLMLKFRKKVWLLWRKWSWCCWNISSREEEMLTIPTLILTSDTNTASPLRGAGGGERQEEPANFKQ